MLGNGRHVEPERVQIPKLTTHWGEYQLISLEEAQKRDEIVHPSFDDERAQLKTSDGGLSWPDRERARAEGNKAQEQLDSWTGVGEVGGGLGSPYDVSLPDNAKYTERPQDSSTLPPFAHNVQQDGIEDNSGKGWIMGGTAWAAGGYGWEGRWRPLFLHVPSVVGAGWSGGGGLVPSLA
ncbi:hypothetical protein ONZ51_g5380 [Trametes cubensis]|uniref:Uncharacterized protein n=1 Tax=Trametes cubensis TaxID=1111947 RepID=A0AAD7XDQ2_9APHY|nr:hypothetical protein ONZ51_g5380 [Trametes cubensis]